MIVNSLYPDADIEYIEKFQGYLSVSQGKLDAYVYDKRQMLLAIANGQQGVRVLDETLAEPAKVALGISKNPAIPEFKNSLNYFIDKIKADGTLDDMYERWSVQGNYEMPQIDAPSNPHYHIKVATTGDVAPYSFYQNNELTGYDIEIMKRFGAWFGADIEFFIYDWDSIVPALQAGKVDVISSNLNDTPEREEAIDFSDSLYEIEHGVMVQDKVAASGRVPEYSTFSELSGKTISMLTGAPFENLISSKVPDVKEFTYYQNMPDMMLAVETGKTDAGLMNNAVATLAINRKEDLALFPESLGDTNFGLGFSKGDERAVLWQKTYDAIPKADKDALWEKWTGADESKKTVMKQDWEGKNGSVTVASCDSLEPMSYVGKNGEPMGLDVETILLIAKQLDVHVDFVPMDFSAALSSLGSGKADIACGSIVVTDERKESMDFVEYLPASFVLIVRAKSAGQKTSGFFESIADSFEKTFIREDRYKLFLSGILTTVTITIFSIIFGTALGFLIYMCCRKGKKAPNLIARIFFALIHGMPVVVLLMILYYIIFAKAAVSGTVVAIIAFTLVFASGVFGMLKSGVGAVDKGQEEAALSLGYSDRRSFFRIILPQALPHFLPAFKGEVVSLLKATAIVGYIGVQDLTKMGDIVRGRTYDAFFPLIAVAIFYFALGGLLIFLVSRIEIKIDPKKRKRKKLLKGVNLDA